MDRSHLARSVKSRNSDAQHVFTRSLQAANQPQSESDTDSEVNKDLADEEYNPNESRNKSKETPGEFVGYGSVLSKKTRERVANVSPSGSACSFLGTPYEDHVVDGMHLLRRKTDREYVCASPLPAINAHAILLAPTSRQRVALSSQYKH